MMKSVTAITYELDDVSIAAGELIAQIRDNFVFGSESVGILYGQPDMELGELASLLNAEFGFDIIGGTTAGAAMLLNDGHHELAVVLHVLSASDCRFVSVISDSLEFDSKNRIEETYRLALADLHSCDNTADPAFVFCVSSILQNFSSDDSLSVLSEVTGGLPIFGFLAADDFEFSKQQVFLNGNIGADKMVLLLISGNVKPVFEVRNLAGSRTLSKRLVSKAHDNVICEIDGKPAYEYIAEFPFINDNAGVLWNYQFFVEMQNELDNDGVLVSRVLNNFDKDSGEIYCFANVPENSYIALLYCDDRDVKSTCKKALQSLMSKIQSQADYEYSSVFIASCSIRNMFLANDKDAEGNLVRDIIPPNLVTSGVYAFGEIAPTSIRNGKAVNRFHNSTITICAL